MAQTTPPSIAAAPAVPMRKVKATFGDQVDAFNTWLAAAVTQFGAVATNVYNNALDAFGSATASATSATASATSASTASSAATAALSTANVTLWQSGATVAQDANVISPADRRTYRRKTASGSGTTDPSLDPVNYVCLSGEYPIAVATVTSPVANIDFLNLFTDAYTKYVIELEGLSGAATVAMQAAVGGVVASGASDYASMQPASTSNSMTAAVMLQLNGTPSNGFMTVEVRGARTASTFKSVSVRGRVGTTVQVREGGINIPSSLSGFRLYPSDGSNFTTGTVRVYGVRA